MATTTNYSWTTPDDTALVKDGAAAIRSLGTAIDSTVFTNAGAAINKTIVDAKGDLIVASGADAVARLAVGGTNGHVLTVNSGATNGVEWAALPPAGGQTLLETLTLSGASVTSSTIAGTYKDLKVIVKNYLPATDTTALRLRFNSSSTSNTYFNAEEFTEANNVGYNNTSIPLTTDQDNGASNNLTYIYIPDYANTVTYKSCQVFALNDGTTAGNIGARYLGGNWKNTNAITALQFFPASGNFTSGSILIYGVN